jgi:hypothetical protein
MIDGIDHRRAVSRQVVERACLPRTPEAVLGADVAIGMEVEGFEVRVAGPTGASIALPTRGTGVPARSPNADRPRTAAALICASTEHRRRADRLRMCAKSS